MTSKFEDQASQRVVRLRKHQPSANDDLFDPVGTEARGLSIMRNQRGQLFVCRTSPDGWVQSYAVHDEDGPLMVQKKRKVRKAG